MSENKHVVGIYTMRCYKHKTSGNNKDSAWHYWLWRWGHEPETQAPLEAGEARKQVLLGVPEGTALRHLDFSHRDQFWTVTSRTVRWKMHTVYTTKFVVIWHSNNRKPELRHAERRRKACQPVTLHLAKIFFRNESKIQFPINENKENSFIASWPAPSKK